MIYDIFISYFYNLEVIGGLDIYRLYKIYVFVFQRIATSKLLLVMYN